MKGVLLIHAFSKKRAIFNFDVLIEKTRLNRWRFEHISKLVDKKTSYLASECPCVKKFLSESRKRYWHLGSEDLSHATPDMDFIVVNDLISLKLKAVIMEEC